MFGAEGEPDELRSAFTSTLGGVMTVEVGSVTGDLELRTLPVQDGRVEATVRYAGADEWYLVEGSPVASEGEDHPADHERILNLLTTPGPAIEGNELSRSLPDG